MPQSTAKRKSFKTSSGDLGELKPASQRYTSARPAHAAHLQLAINILDMRVDRHSADLQLYTNFNLV